MIAIIPARAGSKRFPMKNRADFLGKSLVEHTINQAKKSDVFNKIILTSNDSWHESHLKRYDNLIIHQRTDNLAQDETTTEEVVMDVLLSNGHQNGEVCLLQPTSPLRTYLDIKLAVKSWWSKSLVSVSPAAKTHKFNIENILNERQIALHDTMFKDIQLNKVAINGAIYLFKAENFIKYQKFIYSSTQLHIMKKYHLLDIDYREDLDEAIKAALRLRINF
jgi:CMP-N,N'-diacetyllegionaminic acid synthase